MMELQNRLNADVARIEDYLRNVFAGLPPRGDIYPAMEYSLLAGGKRLRPTLALEVCRMCDGNEDTALALGCAVEMVHTYSLIHDDLPAMDNDDLRRGKPTNHKVYGEATAILAGDGLLTAAFGVIAGAGGLTEGQRLAAIHALSAAAGPQGMIGGQILDMQGERHSLTLSEIEELQQLKTGALICCATRMGCIAAQAEREQTQAVERYAGKLGLAFQIQDDILDAVSTTETLGKPVGSDQANHKSTYVTLLGVDECVQRVQTLTQEAKAALDTATWQGDTAFLDWLADQLARRTY